MSVLAAMSASRTAARLRRIAPLPRALDRPGVSGAELGVLIGIGVLTAVLRGTIDLRMGLPGHSIALVAPPLVFGLACVPRRMAGTLMGASALGASLLLPTVGARGAVGAGALTSMFLTGVLLDGTLARARTGRGIYLGCLAAGLGANMAALAVRFAVKLASLTPGDLLHPLAAWWPRAIVTYPLCGAVAGLVSGLVLFRASRSRQPT